MGNWMMTACATALVWALGAGAAPEPGAADWSLDRPLTVQRAIELLLRPTDEGMRRFGNARYVYLEAIRTVCAAERTSALRPQVVRALIATLSHEPPDEARRAASSKSVAIRLMEALSREPRDEAFRTARRLGIDGFFVLSAWEQVRVASAAALARLEPKEAAEPIRALYLRSNSPLVRRMLDPVLKRLGAALPESELTAQERDARDWVLKIARAKVEESLPPLRGLLAEKTADSGTGGRSGALTKLAGAASVVGGSDLEQASDMLLNMLARAESLPFVKARARGFGEASVCFREWILGELDSLCPTPRALSQLEEQVKSVDWWEGAGPMAENVRCRAEVLLSTWQLLLGKPITARERYRYGEPSPPEAHLYRIWRETVDSRRFDEGISRLEAFAKEQAKKPDLAAQAYLRVIDCLWWKSDWDAAIAKAKWLAGALPKAKAPLFVPLQYPLTRVLTVEVREYVGKNPIYIKDFAWGKIAELCQAAGRTEEQLAAYDHLLATVPRDALPDTRNLAIVLLPRLHRDALAAKAELLRRSGRPQEAKEAADLCEKLYPAAEWEKLRAAATEAMHSYQDKPGPWTEHERAAERRRFQEFTDRVRRGDAVYEKKRLDREAEMRARDEERTKKYLEWKREAGSKKQGEPPPLAPP